MIGWLFILCFCFIWPIVHWNRIQKIVIQKAEQTDGFMDGRTDG